MSWPTALGTALLGGIASNIAQKSAIKNQENAENNALNITNQNTARAQGQLRSFWANNPFNKMSPVQGPAPVSGQGAPTMGALGPGLMQALLMANGQPAQTSGMPNAAASMPNTQAAMPSFGQQGAPQAAGARQGMQPGQRQFALPQAPQTAQQPSLQAILSQMYGVR